MEVHVRDDMKLVTVWLTRAKQEDTAIREQLKALYADYKAKKYMVAQFRSGTEDLYRNTRGLVELEDLRDADIRIISIKK